MREHRALLRPNDNFIIQSIPLGDDSLNRAWWFIMGVITQSFSPKSTTWLPTQYRGTHTYMDKYWKTKRERPRDTVGIKDTVTGRSKIHRRLRQTSSYNTEQPWTDTHTAGQANRHITTNARKTTADTRKEWGKHWGMRHTSLMPANSRNNFLVLISKGDGEMRSWLWELISIKIENEIKGD